MRNILMTVMLLAVVAVLFMNIVGGSGGLRSQIEAHGSEANSKIVDLQP